MTYKYEFHFTNRNRMMGLYRSATNGKIAAQFQRHSRLFKKEGIKSFQEDRT